ncbi:MAG: hypothetical protein LQ337_008545 [Flavoplaca oasis]|nr:MAG: hypothetical protein LQ337_008545 [Flavoplaca oasis]
MKSFGLLSFGLLFVTSLSGVLAIPQDYSTNPGSVNATQPAPQPLPQPESLNDTLTLASDVLAIQLVGAQPDQKALEELANNFPLVRLRASGYDTTRMHHVFSQAANVTASFPSLTEYIWIYQAVGALNKDKVLIQQLCDSINVAASFGIGHNGTLVKTTICDYANGIELPKPVAPRFEDKRFNDGGSRMAL